MMSQLLNRQNYKTTITATAFTFMYLYTNSFLCNKEEKNPIKLI